MALLSSNEYLRGVAPAVGSIFSAILSEEQKIAQCSRLLPAGSTWRNLGKYRDHLCSNFRHVETSEDADPMRTLHTYGQYVSAGQLIVSHEATAGVLYAALLQIAKQAISFMHGSSGRACGLVREVGGIPLAQLIWDARNQAMHFEDGCHGKNTRDTFAILASAFGDKFCLGHNSGRNLARLVVSDLLKWRTGADFYTDVAAVASAEVPSA